MEKKKLLKSNGFYNLVQLKTHLQDEGILELESMHELITKFTSIVSNYSFTIRQLTKFYKT